MVNGYEVSLGKQFMTKFWTIAIAFVLVTPFALATLSQAALIVA
jgi:hypothetical protein